jgi:hypothetical protein
MTIGFLPYGSSDSSVIFQHDLKTRLTASDISSGWSGDLEVGDSTGWTAIGSATDFPTHDSVKGLKQVSVTDGSTPVGYKFNNSSIDLSNQGQITFEIETAAIESYDATYNSGAWQPASTFYPVMGFSGTGNDHIYFLTIESGQTHDSWHGCAHVSKDIENSLANFAPDTTGNPPKILGANAYGSGFTKVSISWKSNYAILALDDIVIGWGNRLFVTSSDWLNNFFLGGRNGTAAEMLVDYHIRNLQISTKPASFSRSYNFGTIGVISDSMFTDVDFDATIENGGIHSGIGGIRKAFNEKGLYSNIVVSTNSGEKVDNSIVVTPLSLTSSGTTATMIFGSDPGWQTGNIVSITGASEYHYNGSFSITRSSATVYTYTMTAAASASPATGTITAGRSIQVSVKNLLNDNPKMKHIFVHATTNDLNSAETAADTETDYKALIDTIFSYDNIDSMTVVIPPARITGGDLDLQEEYNAMFPSLKTYAESTYSGKKLNFADVWTSTGGRSPVTGTLQADNIHYGAIGSTHLSKVCYEAMKEAFSL